MPSLKLSNPFRRGADRPSLKERAAALRETAGRVTNPAKPEPKAALKAPDARAFAVEQAAAVDLSRLDIMQLGVLFDRFDAAANMWNAELHLPYANDGKGYFRLNTAAGEIIEREQGRVAEIRDHIAAEIGRRQPARQLEANTQLETLVRHELMCNGDLRDPAIRARIEATWGEAPASDASAENVVPQPKPEVLASPSFVEAELMALAAEYEGFARVSDEAVTREDEVGLPLPDALDNAIDRARRFTNQGRESTVRHAMALPATTLLGFGLKAQILEHDAGAAWGENEDDIDIVRCRAFLHALIAAAGLSPIRHLEVTSDEVRGWLADPSTAPGADKAGA